MRRSLILVVRCMEEDLKQLVEKTMRCYDSNPLWPDKYIPFCKTHNLSKDEFFFSFAKHVALEFAHGEISYSDGDVAMNHLQGAAELGLTGFALSVYLAFDDGEYHHNDDQIGTISWQTYTLPAIMEALVNEGFLPNT